MSLSLGAGIVQWHISHVVVEKVLFTTACEKVSFGQTLTESTEPDNWILSVSICLSHYYIFKRLILLSPFGRYFRIQF